MAKDSEENFAKVRTTSFGIFPEVCAPVFLVSAGLIIAFIIFGAGFTGTAEGVFMDVQSWISSTFGWFYILSASIFLIFVIALMASRYGHVRLGDPFESPRFSLVGWFAMLFSAGMGIGLLFWSVAEPLFHYMSPPHGEGDSAEAAIRAMRYTYYHWGLHPWAIYSVTGLSIAYFAFRQKLPLTIRSAFYPLLGDRIYGPIGHIIDILAVFGTMFGVATSLGLGVLQINAGLNHVFGITESSFVQVILIAIITGFATISVVLGLTKGIQRLSQFNIILSVILLLFILVAGPTLFILRFFVETSGDYLQNLIGMSFWNDTFANTGWQNSWTIFYWGWWISWAPFVGMFIARVSRGRTIREFALGVLLAPTLATFVWLSIFGGTALNLEVNEGVGLAAAAQENVATTLFVMLEELPWNAIISLLAVVMIVSYFVTSSDSGSLVIDMLTAGGHTDPPKSQRVFWAVTEGVVAAVLLVAGGLEALQAASITAGLPFCVIMVGMCYCLVKGLREEPITPDPQETEPEAPSETMGEISSNENEASQAGS